MKFVVIPNRAVFYLRLGWVRREINALDRNDIIFPVCVAEFEGRVARDVELVVAEEALATIFTTEEVEAADGHEAEGQGSDDGEPHRRQRIFGIA